MRSRRGAYNMQTRRSFLGVAILALSTAAGLTVTPNASAREHGQSASHRWVGTWSTSPMPAEATFGPAPLSFEDQTLRQIVHVSVGGTRVRVRLSNQMGSTALNIGAAHLAHQDQGASIVPCSDRSVTFSGQTSVVIQPGEAVLSDPVSLDVPASSNLAISLFAPEATGPVTWHETAQQTTYISGAGDHSGETTLPTQATATSYYWVSGVEVLSRPRTFSVVAFGDSITDGMGSTVDANRRWPDCLSQRLNAPGDRRYGAVGVLNQGISGNRVLHDFVGPNALSRFDRDVLDQAGVKHAFVQIGINDIGLAAAFGIPDQEVTADELIAGLEELADRAHGQGLQVYGGTLTPCEGTYPGYYSPEHEATRQAVNAWIRTSGTFDAVVDFDAVLRDPVQPTMLLPAYDSGDHLHPNDLGYQAMANAVDLDLLQ